MVTYGKVVKWVIHANTLPKLITRWVIHVLPKFYRYGLGTDIGYIVASFTDMVARARDGAGT